MELRTLPVSPKAASLRFWYGALIAEFVVAPAENVVGQLTFNSDIAIIPTQRDAWRMEIEFLQSQLKGLTGSIFFEFNIPRMGRRIDVVLVVGPVVFAIEFKVGETTFDRSAIDQVWDYGLDLKNFHKASHDASIIPILIATEATECPPVNLHADADKLYRPIIVDPQGFRGALDSAVRAVGGAAVNAEIWSRASYHPTPTIVEAARALYAQHSVEAIARFVDQRVIAEVMNVLNKRLYTFADFSFPHFLTLSLPPRDFVPRIRYLSGAKIGLSSCAWSAAARKSTQVKPASMRGSMQ